MLCIAACSFDYTCVMQIDALMRKYKGREGKLLKLAQEKYETVTSETVTSETVTCETARSETANSETEVDETVAGDAVAGELLCVYSMRLWYFQ
jgi:hypothetical protein